MIHDSTTGNNYDYDAENRITGVAGFTYTYDADGNRVEKSNGTTGTIYWPMSPGIVAESDLKGNLTSEYVFFNGKRVTRRDFSKPKSPKFTDPKAHRVSGTCVLWNRCVVTDARAFILYLK